MKGNAHQSILPVLTYRSKSKTNDLQFLNFVLVFGKPFQNSIHKFSVTRLPPLKRTSLKVGRICTSIPPVDQKNHFIGLYDDISHGNIKVGHDHAVTDRAFKRRMIDLYPAASLTNSQPVAVPFFDISN
jgi:hypothetical protein